MRRRNARIVLAIVVLAALLAAAVSKHVYRTSEPYRLVTAIFGEGDTDFEAVVLRKLYSLIAFTVAGIVVDLALPRARRPVLRGTIAIAAFSACIEIAQRLHHVHEGIASNLFDVGCGAVGGAIGAAIVEPLRARGRRAR